MHEKNTLNKLFALLNEHRNTDWLHWSLSKKYLYRLEDFPSIEKIKKERLGHEETVKILIGQFAPNVNFKDEKGRTPLHVAAWRGRDEMVKILIDHGANVNFKDANGWTPIKVAASFGNSNENSSNIQAKSQNRFISLFRSA
ncbi:26S proteasome non-ATPase regulatory subunit 10-like [Sitodiplosis mosellana]|uniref:26S proteasome non-ATPase regulatory subunit 10-like n=1 Tax=Sitodiplosis mosellana TaxID=263140 RepID=UPI002444A9C0|nr:26S proteasome non-ATPase regulatory subunit 10-like [Sitodiplosis mosellana]